MIQRFMMSLTVLIAVGCSDEPAAGDLTDAELAEVQSVIQTYADSWVAMDSSAVLRLFTEDAVIVPSGLHPREGKQALREFWFPKDSSVTRVQAYTIDVLDAGGTGRHAFTFERGDLSFTYALGDFFMSRTTKAHATTLYEKQQDGAWKITHRMWTDLRIEH